MAKVSPLGGIWNSTKKPSRSAKGSRLNESVPTRRNMEQYGKAFPLGGKAFPFGESGAQAPREVTKLHGRKFQLNNL